MRTKVIVQPAEAKMGAIITELLSSREPFYNKVWLVSAFVNSQTIRRLTPSILASTENGAQISIIAGFDVRSSSVEALRNINSLGVNAYLVHNARSGHTFHPKMYLFEATGVRAEIFIGSNNLTDGGFYTNYEASSQTTFDFPQDNAEYAEFIAPIDRYLNPRGTTAQTLSDELIQILVNRGELPTESELQKSRAKVLGVQEQPDIPNSPFGVERITRPPRLRRSGTEEISVQTTIAIAIAETPEHPSSHGDLIWQKNELPRSDAQQTRPGSNPTGVLSLNFAL